MQDNDYPNQRKAYLTLKVTLKDSDDQDPAFVYPGCPLIDHFCATPLYEAVARKNFKVMFLFNAFIHKSLGRFISLSLIRS